MPILAVSGKENISEFIILMDRAVDRLKTIAREDPNHFLSIGENATRFEVDVEVAMNEASVGTSFEGEIIRWSGHKFPDITAKRFYGIEVKTSIKDIWESTGNSVLETTRVEGVEKIFILFGKFGGDIDFRYREYEKCLKDIKITHSPRYAIDMNTPDGESILDRMGITYNDFRRLDRPIASVQNYFREIAGPNEYTWWLDTGDDSARVTEAIVRTDLEPDETIDLRNQMFALFPTVFSKSSNKYREAVVWLLEKHSVVLPSFRDKFSAGGKVRVGNYRIPKKYALLLTNMNDVIAELLAIEDETLRQYWDGFSGSDQERIYEWIRRVTAVSASDIAHECPGFDLRSEIITRIRRTRSDISRYNQP